MDENLCITIRSIQLPASAYTHNAEDAVLRSVMQRERKNHGIIMKIVLIWEGVSFYRQERSTQQKEKKPTKLGYWAKLQHKNDNHTSITTRSMFLWHFHYEIS